MNARILSHLKIGQTDIIPVTALNHEQHIKFDIHQYFPLITYSSKAYLRVLVNQLLSKQNLKYRVLYETDNANNVKDLVLQGLGIAWLPALTIQHELETGLLQICDDELIYKNQEIYIFKSNLAHRESISQLWNILKME